MRSLFLPALVAVALLCAACNEESNLLSAENSAANAEVEAALSKHKGQTRYAIKQLGTLGGASAGNGISNPGTVVGSSTLPSGVQRAALWRKGSVVDLGSLGGPNTNSSVVWPGQNNRDMVVGISQTDVPSPLGQTWSCSAFLPYVGTTCLGFAWENGVMTPMPTLGGHNSFATGVNSRGQVVGWAETPIEDPTCNEEDGNQILQFRAVVWEPKRETIRELPPLPGDSTSAATAINSRGQVVGISGDCDMAVGRFSARHAVLWDGDRVIDIGNLGGAAWHTPMAINQRGDVVGFSNPPGGEDGDFNVQAFFWTRKGGIDGLGTLPGDGSSQALGINERRQVVGLSSGPDGARAVIWEDGVATDLNSLAEGYAGHLIYAGDVNNKGEITGAAVDAETGEQVTFLASPIRGHK